ncbi:hypothetical protein DERF_015877 [Dermatophagoides farinae]|uniref:Uncharacterized protein n=1 Tax=Dermatophagoides farinae TaxID=6954 RepID=A0A922HMY2_DERFA|nr:hypothetical protein DERF_015877 [Dermatophagoides farinae]
MDDHVFPASLANNKLRKDYSFQNLDSLIEQILMAWLPLYNIFTYEIYMSKSNDDNDHDHHIVLQQKRPRKNK